jgi:hypothetical protein
VVEDVVVVEDVAVLIQRKFSLNPIVTKVSSLPRARRKSCW